MIVKIYSIAANLHLIRYDIDNDFQTCAQCFLFIHWNLNKIYRHIIFWINKFLFEPPVIFQIRTEIFSKTKEVKNKHEWETKMFLLFNI